MFSNDDIRSIHDLIPPPASQVHSLPSLVLAQHGGGFITLQHVQKNFEATMIEENDRLPLAKFAETLNVDPKFLLQVVQGHPHLALLSNDRSKVLSKSSRDATCKNLRDALETRLVTKVTFAEEHSIDEASLDALLKAENDLITYDGCVCNKAYDSKLSNAVLSLISSAIANIININILPDDASQLPGSPPMWLVLRHMQTLIETRGLGNDVFIREHASYIQCQSKRAKEQSATAWSTKLVSGADPCLDLQSVLEKDSELYASVKDAETEFARISGVDVVGTHAISRAWVNQFEQNSLQELSTKGIINVAQQLAEDFPDSVLDYVVQEVEKAILSEAQKPDAKLKVHHAGSFFLTAERREAEQASLFDAVKADATAQWQVRQSNHDHELKFKPPKTSDVDKRTNPIHQALLQDKQIEKMAEENFWTSVSSHEAANETDFSTFWSDRIVSRISIYTTGLTAIEDSKLSSQLSELLAAYIQKDLVPDSIAKARSQGLALSRRTSKNIAKLETALLATKPEVEALVSTLDKFSKKQDIPALDGSALEESKSTMVKDMLRRMQKQQKAADGPVLFLTLVIVLFARHFAGVVYATGKFAPKLLKQLKAKLEEGEYEQVEKWKEAAKAGSLSAEDREEMRKMSGA